MKTILTRLLALSGIALLMLTGCKKNDVVVTSNGGKAGTLTASSTTPALTKARIADTTKIINFTFTQANYGYSGAAVTNTLQIDKAGDNWANPTSVTLSAKVLAQGYNTLDFDKLLLALGLPGGTSASINVRVAQAISTTLTPAYSNVISMTVTPFNLTSWIYIVGAFQGWNATSPDSLLSATSNGVYVGVINFTAGNNQFLILPAKSFNNKYATTQSSTPTSTVAYNAGNNLIAPAAAGQYLVTFNLTAGTISFTPADYYSIIGDGAIDWNTDIPMKYTNDANGTWVVTTTLNTTGSFKVRQDNAWTNSWGLPQTGSEGYGIANTLNNTKNNNITVSAAGSYNISFIGNATAFGTKVDANAGDNNIITTTYSVVKIN
jgi:hypothetical protein